MTNLTISHAPFECIYHDSKKCGGNTHCEYVYHNVDVSTTLTINEKDYQINYQAGHDYYQGDYSLPCEELSLEEIAGTDAVISTIEKIDVTMFDDMDDVSEILSDNDIDFTAEQAFQIYTYIREYLDIDADLEYASLIESSADEIESSLQDQEDQKEMEREAWKA